MKTTLRKTLALLLCLSLCLSLVPAAYAKEPQVRESVGAGDLKLVGDSGIGALTARLLEQEGNEETPPGAVTDITVSGAAASVTLSTDRAATLVVSLCQEDDGQLLASAVQEVGAEDTSADVSFVIDQMPDYFVVAAYLLDAETQAPISDEYVTRYYTRAFQAFLSKTTADYDPELVLNLDEDESTNYLVFREDILRCTEHDGVNSLTDHGDGSYSVYNADESVRALSVGDGFSLTAADGTITVLRVASVSVSDTTVTITEDETATLTDIFAYIRLEESSEGADAYIDPEDMDEGVSFLGASSETLESFAATDTPYYLNAPEAVLAAPLPGTEISASESGVVSASALLGAAVEGNVGVNFHFEFNTGDNIVSADPSVGLHGTLDLGLSLKLKIYFSDGWVYTSCKLDIGAQLAAGVNARCDLVLGLGKPTILLGGTGLKACFPLRLVLEAEAKAELCGTLKSTLGFVYDSDSGFSNLSSWPSFQVDSEVTGSVFFGLELEMELSTIFDVSFKRFKINLADASLVIRLGVRLDGQMSGRDFAYGDGDSIHDCHQCFDGDLTLSGSVSVDLNLLNDYFTSSFTLLEINFKLADFYYSFDFQEFGWGRTCPHIAHRTDIRVRMTDGSAVSGASVFVSEAGEKLVTDGNGTALIYLPNGTYNIFVNSEDYFREKTVIIQHEKKTVEFVLDDPEDDPGDYTGGGSGNIKWKKDKDSGTLIVYGSGVVSRNTEMFSGFRLKTLIVLSGITGIGDEAFKQCSFLSSLTLPGTLESIGRDAFAECTSLTSVAIPAGAALVGDPFRACTSLSSVVIPAGVSFAWAFAGCTQLKSLGPLGSGCNIEVGCWKDTVPAGACSLINSLTSVTIPNGVTGIGEMAFQGCEALSSIAFPTSLTDIGKLSFYGCKSLSSLALPARLAGIGEKAFEGCTALSSVTIPGRVRSVGESAFKGCTAMEAATISKGVTAIGANAFNGCSSLSSLTMHEGLNSIGNGAFCDCKLLSAVVIPEGVVSVGNDLFLRCSSLSSITVPSTLNSFGYSFCHECPLIKSAGPIGSGCNIEFAWKETVPYLFFSYIGTLTKLILPEGVTRIDAYALSLPNLTSLTIPDSVTSIGMNALSSPLLKSMGPIGSGCNIEFAWKTSIPDQAFSGTYLTSAAIPEGITDIGSGAFSSCAALVTVTIPDSVVSIGDGAFEGCTSLASVRLPKDIGNIGSRVFSGCSSLSSVTFSPNVTGIGESAFNGCGTLADVWYGGTQAQWDEIDIGNGNEPLRRAVIHYSAVLPAPDFILPAALTEIGEEAFSGGAFSHVKLSENTVRIGENAFADCPRLSFIYIPAAATSIDPLAFGDRTALTVYGGAKTTAEAYAKEHGYLFIAVS